MTVLCLRILQAALVYVNTLMLQDVLADQQWSALLTAEDRRGLTCCSGSTSCLTAKWNSTWKPG
jgi:hypothetical protein